MHWFCWYHGWSDDPRFRLVGGQTDLCVASVLGVWLKIIEHASMAEERGTVIGLDLSLLAFCSEIDEHATEALVGQFRNVGLIEDDRIAGWDKYQLKRNDPTNAQRQMRHRASRNVTARCVTAQDRTIQDNTEHHRQEGPCLKAPVFESDRDENIRFLEDSVVSGEATIAELNLGCDPILTAEAISISQRQRPGADPQMVVASFAIWGAARKQKNWQRALATFAGKERLTDDEIRAEQAAIAAGIGPRRPGESLEDFRSRTKLPADAAGQIRLRQLINEQSKS